MIKETFNDLPLIYLDINKEKDGVTEIAIVDKPAIESNFKAFSSTQVKFTADKEKRLIMGAILIPDFPIYRRDKTGEYYVMFTRDVVEQAAHKFMRTKSGDSSNLMHDQGLKPDGVYVAESWIIDSSRGIKAPEGFEDLNEGTWFGAQKVENDEVWNDYIKKGIFKGFSIEGLFDQSYERPVKAESQQPDIIEQLKSLLAPFK